MANAFMQEAIERAVENVRSGRGGPFAAVVVKEGRIIAAGANCVTSTNDPTAHAEVTAIREACRILGTFYWARPERVYFGATARDASAAGFDDSFIYDELKRPHTERRIPLEPMMREAALEPFREWGQKGDRVRY